MLEYFHFNSYFILFLKKKLQLSLYILTIINTSYIYYFVIQITKSCMIVEDI